MCSVGIGIERSAQEFERGEPLFSGLGEPVVDLAIVVLQPADGERGAVEGKFGGGRRGHSPDGSRANACGKDWLNSAAPCVGSPRSCSTRCARQFTVGESQTLQPDSLQTARRTECTSPTGGPFITTLPASTKHVRFDAEDGEFAGGENEVGFDAEGIRFRSLGPPAKRRAPPPAGDAVDVGVYDESELDIRD